VRPTLKCATIGWMPLGGFTWVDLRRRRPKTAIVVDDTR
jgi:hypothetical protein